MIELGQTGVDKATGFKGVCTSRIEYLDSAADRCELSPKIVDGVRPVEPRWFDEGRIEVANSGEESAG